MFLKALYNLKQSANLWLNTFAYEMKELRFYQLKYNRALYLDNKSTYVALYIDDLHIVGTDLNCI